MNTEKKNITVVFCIPGSSFSGKFIECCTSLYIHCITNGITPVISKKESCNIYLVRNMCLGADVSRGKDQKPFNGQLDYDYLMWIDSDIVWNPVQVMELIKHDKDIVSGLYLMDNGKQFATVKEWDEEYFKKNGHFQFQTPRDIQGQDGIMEVDYTGFGFMLIRKGVFESMEYPWFRPVYKEIGNAVDFTMEDVGFCLTAKEKGHRIFVDTRVVVGHDVLTTRS